MDPLQLYKFILTLKCRSTVITGATYNYCVSYNIMMMVMDAFMQCMFHQQQIKKLDKVVYFSSLICDKINLLEFSIS